MINITLSAAGGCLTASLFCAVAENLLDITVILNGILSGAHQPRQNCALLLAFPLC